MLKTIIWEIATVHLPDLAARLEEMVPPLPEETK